jgi:hypothetical protein
MTSGCTEVVMRRVIATLLMLVLSACSPVDMLETDIADQQDIAVLDSAEDVSRTEDGADIPDHEITLDITSELPLDVVTEIDSGGPQCALGEGCFLDPCADNGQCQNGWCVEHMGEGVCSQQCKEECPPGWTCKQVGGDGPDVTWICVSSHANLCKPCATTEGCTSPGGAQDACLDYGDEGSFCGGSCSVDDDCPWGFSCADTSTVDGVDVRQCLAESGVCPCTSKSVALALMTPCEISNESGTCIGKRVCTETGLSDCDAALPADEVCNGLDDNCNGTLDEPKEFDGNFANLCTDDNDCTQDTCNGETGCSHTALNAGECKDLDACTVGDHCEQGVCIGNPVTCDDDNPCTTDACDGAGGCLFENNIATCDDDDPCTVADQCKDGVCTGYAVNCSCQTDDECMAIDDDNACNGTLLCDKSALPYQCVVNPDTIIECQPPEPGPDAACLQAYCNPADGSCALEPTNDAAPCNDGDLCTVGDTCLDGSCSGGATVNCNDGNLCTDDTCTPDLGCVNTPNQESCNDNDVCTAGDTCEAGQCVGGPLIECNDGNACNGLETCNSNVGCKSGQPLLCDDQNLCNGVEHCDPLLGCQDGQVLSCDDSNLCTVDSCDANQGCLYEYLDTACDDGNLCTIGDSCSNGVCLPGEEPLPCTDENPCTTDSCKPATGCTYTLNTDSCNDGDICTLNDHCQLGQCTGGGQLPCNDSNPCTDDSCDAGTGCQFTPNQETCDDGNACTTGDHCANGTCMASGAQSCDDANPCTTDSCNPDSGCLHTPSEGICNDDDLCTLGDFCQNGKCTGGQPLDCDDANVCTQDLCAGDAGCQHTPLSDLECDDANPCTTIDLCLEGTCLGNGEKDCDDGEVCTDDACTDGIGCVYNDNNATCEDNNACTLVDICANGSCYGSESPTCNDGNKCTEDACLPPGGCLYTPIVPCCGDNQIDVPEECDDGNSNSGDGCDENCKEETSVTMQWTDPQTGACGNNIWQTMQNIVAEMPAGPINIEIVAKMVAPGVAGYGDWSATFLQTTCVRQWLQAIANKDTTTYNTWSPAVCQATSTEGDSFYFVCKSDGGNGRQIAIYPVGANSAQYMKIYMIDRSGAWCDLIGVNSRPGFEDPHVNSNTYGVAGDYLRFTWSF